ncbi:MAG: mannose-1-phosphate guanylyltransferase/mannose-6-phosphate isomerase [Desulfopila sp.]
MKIQPVVLAGGTGSRLWPLSREMYPKQLLQLTNERSLLQTTLLRINGIPGALPPIVVVGEEHRFLTSSQIDEMKLFADYTLLLEQRGRNTAPAICGAVEYCRQKIAEDLIMLVLPADHIVREQTAFLQAVDEAMALAAKGSIVTFGIPPTHPETGYGYIERGPGNAVVSFTEKPDQDTASRYLERGEYLWNSGMFAFSLKTFVEEMQVHGRVILEQMATAVENGAVDGVFFRFAAQAMEHCPSDSIDYALMEKTSRAAVVTANLGWSDIGSWQALWQVLAKDDEGNVCQGDVLIADTRNCLVRSEKKLVATVGMEDTLVVETADAVLVAPLSRSQDVKRIVEKLQKNHRKEFRFHTTVYRPWGSYTVLEEQDRYQMKRITVHPKAKLSLQMHHHRYEHWVVVRGTARVTNGEETMLLRENESTYIPAGTVHRLENPGVIVLELIEVQIGPYLGEDDIVRFEDVYGRKNDA